MPIRRKHPTWLEDDRERCAGSGGSDASGGVAVYYDAARGKGSHGTLYYGTRRTTLKDPRAELGRGLLRRMLADLGLVPSDLNE